MSSTTWLLRLYPAAWRARYGAELADLLLARPPSGRDRLDLIRGALDAHLNAQLIEDPVIRVPTAADRLLALGAVVAGASFTVWATIISFWSPPWGSMDLADEGLLSAAYGAGMLGMILAVCALLGLAARHVEELGPVGAVSAIVAALAFFVGTAGATIVGILIMTGAMVVLAWPLSRIVHPLIASGLALSTILLTLAMFGFIGSGGQTTFWLLWMGGFGPAWVLLGYGLRRGRRADRMGAAAAEGGVSQTAAGA